MRVDFGDLQGVAPGGIPAYSNGSDSHFSAARNFDGEVMTGFRWQCVEYARRWLMDRKGLLLADVPWAVHIFGLTQVERLSDGEMVPMVAVKNGSSTAPLADTLLIYPSAHDNVVGHVAAITEVGPGWIRICDQNQRFHKWEKDYSAQLEVVESEGTFTVLDRDTDDGVTPVVPLGWMTFPSSPNLLEGVPLVFHQNLHRPVYPNPVLERHTFVPKETKSDWLDLTNPAEKKFVDTFGMDVSRTRLNEAEVNYYSTNLELWFACVRAGNDLHKIFLQETAKVVASDDLLTLFGIPEIFWHRIRHSWATQKRTITGRFDFAFDGKDVLKSFEYNADSASTLLECGRIQDKYAVSVGIAEDSRSSGFRIEDNLKRAWYQTGLTGQLVHFCIDLDEEEEYLALYMMEMAEKAGVQCKLCIMFTNFHFDESGRVLDKEGCPVRAVWKTWMWESGFRDYFAAQKERGPNWKPSSGDTVRLCDILLGDESIMVFEPLWKVIPSNKAILPMIWSANQTHPNILRAEYTLSEELKQSGYARKPIVGRTGQNITLTGSAGDTLLQSDGKFGDRQWVYQELFHLPKRNDYYAILGGWIIGGEYGGTGIREDKTLITGVDSPFSALRIKVHFNTQKVTHESLKKEEETKKE